MTADEQNEILALLDRERQTVLYPGVTRHRDAEVVRDVSDDGGEAIIQYACCSDAAVDSVIAEQIHKAREAGYELEWKWYGHDKPARLGERLTAAGFEPDEREAVLVFRASEAALTQYGANPFDIRRVTDPQGLKDYQLIREEVLGQPCERQIAQYREMLERHPRNMSIHVAYVEGEPAACGRIYFHEDSRFATLCGGQTRERFRRRGLFTQLVAARIREALSRGVVLITVDALPTSEPILRKRGFESLTHTQPFCFAG